ncbi:MgtC/SapB family protein [Poseidonocella sp. HB161398]|uniref:MgtC/SapB family protein n=1 Tax=Poseidonocella sp. HB161398 TaxID=2320855 RepID=UPI00351425F8
MSNVLEMLGHELAGGFAATPLPVAALRLCAALVLGGALGVERQVRHKAAGLRTHMLIAIAACLFTLIALDLMALPGDTTTLRTDPLRLIPAVTSGVAFLAAGTIIFQGDRVHGLTTGASMWMAGAVGLACGIGNIPMAALATVLALIVLELIRRLEHRG